MHSEAIISHNLSLTAYRAYTTYTPILAPEGCLLEHLLEDGARSGVPRRAAGNRSPWEAPDPARRALGPGCEELAVTDPDASPVREARDRSQKSPRWSAERRASHAEGRKAPHKRLACPNTPNGCLASTRRSFGAPPTPHSGCAKQKQNPGRKKRAAGTRSRRQGFGGLTCPPKLQRRRENEEVLT